MSTTSSITIKTKEGKFKSIYCNYDGYIDNNVGVAFHLQNYFRSYRKASALINQGGASQIGEGLKDSVFYVRDRGEKMDHNEADTHTQYKDVQKLFSVNYNYLWMDSKWYVSEDGGELREVKKELEKVSE